MTLPFRRRHNDAEAPHDRARALSSRRLLEPLEGDDEAWLDRHLDACTECRRDDEAYAADRALLRSLRDKPIEPPRDLWARTSAALDAAAAKRGPSGERRPIWRSLPVGALAGVAVLLVVIGTTLLVPGISPRPGEPTGPPVAQGSPSFEPGPTPIHVTAADVPVLRPGVGGSFDVVVTKIGSVCLRTKPECVPPPSEHVDSTVTLGEVKPSTLTLSPGNDALVFEGVGGTAGEGRILIIPLSPKNPPSQAPATPTAGPAETPTQGPGESATPSLPPESQGPTPEPTPPGQIEIASGVTLVGEVGYSSDGKWLAFSAKPIDGSAGPDLFIYASGAAAATQVTTDHQSYFSGWIGNRILASRVDVAAPEPAASGDPATSVAPSISAEPSPGAPREGHATSFLLDPATSVRADLPGADVWMPVVDPSSHLIAYWSGSLRSTDGINWQLGEGQVVLDGFSLAYVVPVDGSPAPDASTGATATSDASAPPEATGIVIGLAGHPTPLVTSHVEDFRARFDPEGTHLAVWVSEHADGSDGRLHLVVIDPATGGIRSDVPQPLTGVPALRRFSMAEHRLAWVTPSGQDGQQSTLQVLGWSGDDFGEIQSEPDSDVLILR
jgi:hypothetical protein